MLRKTIPLAASKLAIKAEDGGPGQLVGYASVFGGIDAYGDTIVKGAYQDTLPSFVARGTLHSEHDTRLRLGTIRSAEEDDHGLLIVADFYSDPEAQRVRQQIAERLDRGKFAGLSIGYVPEEYDYRDPKDGEQLPPFASKVRVLHRIRLLEISEVTIPADESAEVIAAKSRTFESQSEDVQVAVREWLERCRQGADIRQKDGRDISPARRDQMATLSGSLREAADEVDALLVPPPAPEVINVGAELRRRRYAAGLLERPA